jgi:hypothetical protein
LKAGSIKEVIHTKWVANPMLVPKKNTKVLRMSVDYTGLNKACPKDSFPLPRIDQVIDSTAGSDDKDQADDPMSFVPIFHSESTWI